MLGGVGVEDARGGGETVTLLTLRCTFLCFPVLVLVCIRDLVFTLNLISLIWRMTHAVPCCKYADSSLLLCSVPYSSHLLSSLSHCHTGVGCESWSVSSPAVSNILFVSSTADTQLPRNTKILTLHFIRD